jgi:indian hedgehog protein
MNRGSVSVSDLTTNDLVKSFDSSSNEWKFSRFVFFLHKDEKTLTEYISIKTSSNKNLKISSMHLIPKRVNENDMEFVLAKNLKLNDILISEDNQNEIIIDLTKVVEQGAYAPLLETGTISVNNILASCYANTKWQGLVHFAFQPVIQLSNFFNMESTQTNNEILPNGINWYAGLLSSFLPFIPMSSSFVYL